MQAANAGELMMAGWRDRRSQRPGGSRALAVGDFFHPLETQVDTVLSGPVVGMVWQAGARARGSPSIQVASSQSAVLQRKVFVIRADADADVQEAPPSLKQIFETVRTTE